MRRGLYFVAFVLFLVCSTQLVLAQHQLDNGSINIKGEEFDITIYDPQKSVPFVELQCIPHQESDRIYATLIFKNIGSKTLFGPEYTWEGKTSTGNDLIPSSVQKLNVSIKYSGEQVITKKAGVKGNFGTNSYYTADYTIRFYITDEDVTARVVQGTDVDVGKTTPREEVQNIKRVLPYFYEIMNAINDVKERILSFQPGQSSDPSTPSSTSPKRMIIIEEISEEAGEDRVKKKDEYVKIEYFTTIQKVIVEFDYGNEAGYRVAHKVNILESNATGSVLWIVLSVPKDIAATTESMILPGDTTVLQEDPIVGLEIPSEEGSEGELEVTTLTSVSEAEFLDGIEITHSLSSGDAEVNLLGQNLSATSYILIVTAILSTALIFLSLRRRAGR